MLAIIGGSGLYSLQDLAAPDTREVVTEFANDPVVVDVYSSEMGPVAFMPRHGKTHGIPPHRINYRANIAALAQLGVREIVAINAVGGITDGMAPGSFILPDQIIDYTSGREATFYDGNLGQVVHVDFSNPFAARLSARLESAVQAVNRNVNTPRSLQTRGVYGCTQGPRLETVAEIQRLARDGCDVVGMTAMPEAVLAREKEIDYAMLALSVNWAAGIVPGIITMADIQAVMDEGMDFVRQVLQKLLMAQPEDREITV